MLSVILSLLIGFSTSQYVVNGDFEQDLSVGWKQILNGSGASVNRATNYDPDPDYEVMVRKTDGGGYALLNQTVTVPTTDIVFSASVRLYAYATSTAWAGTALSLKYLDISGNVLGQTRICSKTSYCPWANSPTMHLIQAVDSQWHNYSFNVGTELTNLTGVDPLQVNKIEIALFDSTYDC